MKRVYDIAGQRVVLTCGEEEAETANFLAAILRQQCTLGPILAAGKRIQVGWNFFQLAETEDGLALLAPDYRKNPFTDTTEDLSQALAVFQGQLNALRRAGRHPVVDVSFQDTLIMRWTALKAPVLYLQRLTSSRPPDSGWYLGPLGEPRSDAPKDYTRIYTYQLLEICPQGLALLPFPPGTLAVFDHGQLVEAVDGENQKLL